MVFHSSLASAARAARSWGKEAADPAAKSAFDTDCAPERKERCSHRKTIEEIERKDDRRKTRQCGPLKPLRSDNYTDPDATDIEADAATKAETETWQTVKNTRHERR